MQNLRYPKALLIRGETPDLPWVTLFYSRLKFEGLYRRAVRIAGGLLAAFALVVGIGYMTWQMAANSAASDQLQAGTPTFIPGQPDVLVISSGQPINGPVPVAPAPTAPITTTSPQGVAAPKAVPQGHRLLISKIGVSMPIVEGQNERVLMRGAWRSPWSSSPEKGGNTVLFGHRYLHLPPHPETFFSLDKLAVGDTLEVQWEGKAYTYRVVETKVISPKDVSVLQPTTRPTLTLITCTPVFTTKQRLVVRAELVE